MKKIILLIVSLLLLTSCSQKSETIPNKNPENNNLVKVIDESFTYNDDKTNSSTLIAYPVISQMADEDLENSINLKLKNDALSVLKRYDYQAENAKLEINYEVKTINENAVSIAFKGSFIEKNSSYPVSVFYTSNIDLTTGKNIRLNELCDVSSVSKWLTTSKTFKALSTDSELATAQNDYILTLQSEDLKEQLELADFDENSKFPEAFSYFEAGNVIISIPVTHAIGDHAEYIILTSSIK